MLIEIHMIQNHSPSNINRDDLGAPKTCMFGATLRARISSQCIKRSIRNPGRLEEGGRKPSLFAETMAHHLGVRTKLFPHLVAELLKRGQYADVPDDEKTKIVVACERIAKSEDRQGTAEPVEQLDDRPTTAQLIFLGPTEAESFVKRLLELRMSKDFKGQYQAFLAGDTGSESAGSEEAGEAPPSSRGRQKKQAKPLALLRELRKSYAKRSVDIALFGRMTTSDAFEDVEAAMEVAHAISTHEIGRNEVDYFTAVDDLGVGPGAGHVAENQFNSATYYKYFSLDWELLVHNLAGPKPTEEDLRTHPDSLRKWQENAQKATELAGKTLGFFIRAAALTVPSGKKKGHANNNPPDGILVELKRERIPTSYANAFVEPVKKTHENDTVSESVKRLGDYMDCVVRGFGIQSDRFWFSPKGLPLTCRVGAQAQPVAAQKQTLDDLISATLGVLGMQWEQLKSLPTSEAKP